MMAVLSKSTKMVLNFFFHFPAPLRNELPEERVYFIAEGHQKVKTIASSFKFN